MNTLPRIAGRNNRTGTGRKHYYKPSLLLIETSIIPNLNSRARVENKGKELRVQVIPFERSKRQLIGENRTEHFKRDLESHKKKVEKALDKHTEIYRKKLKIKDHETFECFHSLNKFQKTSTKIIIN